LGALKDIEDVLSLETDSSLLTICRASLHKEGEGSPTALAAFQQFHDKWRAEVKRRVIVKLDGKFLQYAEDLVQATFFMAWEWVGSSSGLPNPNTLLNTCIERSHAELMREFFGRHKTSEQVQRNEDQENSAYVPGTDRRFPLSLDYDGEGLQTLIESIADLVDVEQELLYNEEKKLLREGLMALPSHYRDCLVCRFYHKLNVPETMKVLGYKYNQVTGYTAAGIARLTKFMLEGLSD
jgi:DNA-directed RNA polymerase specialized sigma24 family protein